MKRLEAPIPRLALTAAEAAASIGMAPDTFDQHVAPYVRPIRRGRKRLYAVTELQRWVEENSEAPMLEQVGGA